MPRLLDLERCPHCKAELGRPMPRTCPSCGGSLQQRYLAWGCLTSKPPVLFLALALSLSAYAGGNLSSEPTGRCIGADGSQTTLDERCDTHPVRPRARNDRGEEEDQDEEERDEGQGR